MGKGAVIGGSVGAFLAGIIFAGLLGLYLAERRLRKHSQGAAPNATGSYVNPVTNLHVELQGKETSMVGPTGPKQRQVGTGPPKYEMEAREVFETA